MIFRTDLQPAPLADRRLARPDRRRSCSTATAGSAASPLGGRPTELAFAPDGKTLYVANYLADAVQVVDAEIGEAGPDDPPGRPRRRSRWPAGARSSSTTPTRSFNQWYSCNTCHSDGHTNGLDFDTLNDGRQDLSTAHLRSRKKVPTLRRVDPDRPLDLARLADRASTTPWSSRSPRACKGPKPIGRGRQGARRLPRDARLSRGTRTAIRRRRALARGRARRGRLPVGQGRLQHLPRRPRADRRQDPHRRPRRARRRLPGLQPPVAPRRLRQGPLPPRRPLQNPARGPRRPPQRRGRHRPGRADRAGAVRPDRLSEDALISLMY